MRLFPSAVLATTFALAMPATARAEASPEPQDEARHEAHPTHLLLEGVGAVGGPLGWLGGGLVVSPIPELALHGGAGLGSQGLQLGAGGRVRIRTKTPWSVGVGASWSTGRFAGVDAPSFPIPHTVDDEELIWLWRRAHFVNMEVSLERFHGPVGIRPFLGLGYVLNGADAERTNHRDLTPFHVRDVDTAARLVPYVGFAVAFGVL